MLKENTQTRAIKGNIIYRAMRALVRVYSMLVFNMDIEKAENLPDGPKIFVANHPSLTDPFILQLETHMSVVITGKAFAIPLVGRFLKHIHQISAESGSGTLDKALEHLQNGRSIGIFPEGANSHEGGGMKDFRSGAARLALMSGVPVIPVGIHLRRDRFFQVDILHDRQERHRLVLPVGAIHHDTWQTNGLYRRCGKPGTCPNCHRGDIHPGQIAGNAK